MLRLLFSLGNIFVSLVLGAIALVYVMLNYPATMEMVINWASQLKAWITSSGLPPEYNNWVRLLLEERQLVFMGFTILARLLLSILAILLLPTSASE